MYMWNCELSKYFGILLSYFELCLRNRIHTAMAAHYVGNVGAQAHWWDIVSSQLGVRTMRKVNAVRQNDGAPVMPAPSADEVVSRVSFGFWTAVLDRVDSKKAHIIMPAIFPHHRLNRTPYDWRSPAVKKQAVDFVKEINDFRNRLAHHEPLWKFPSVVVHRYGAPTTVVTASTDRGSSLYRLKRILDIYDDAMAMMTMSLSADLRRSTWRMALDFLLSDRGIHRYEKGKYVPCLAVTAPRDFVRRFSLISKQNAPCRVGRSGCSGLFIPD